MVFRADVLLNAAAAAPGLGAPAESESVYGWTRMEATGRGS
jgi:hypothetical protein